MHVYTRGAYAKEARERRKEKKKKKIRKYDGVSQKRRERDGALSALEI